MKNSIAVLNSIKGGLIVSCQALEDEPLHSSNIMMHMAKAALMGGAVGIRANSPNDCSEIKQNVDLPMIAIYKKVYGNCNVFITPTIEEVKKLLFINPEIIAVDATNRARPDGKILKEFFMEIKQVYRGLIMADVSNVEEGIEAEKIGFDIVSTTLCGYTNYTLDKPKPNIDLIKKLKEVLKIPIIAEGNVDSPENAVKCLDAGAYAVVVGAAITRPQLITKKFVDTINFTNKTTTN
ncbi:N-acetylmannosamine-6-phosphate 2-epimerase [Clostridium lacusfryxellense]|uniref:N-acetylmannosamine-6-phosphate 2-epimerase n=1 Tax=Clostridium lacusfryxellense TaxID=205328 RepID=UPI001C0D2BA7|nr:N-acetylmannosamine-6-phosphate 2-epimerase [Clostridium lacusfryxellense]MBU3110101.1 N-acetylmannosamine-6-phosphate 2-epimerase [Clostridium lacusfryxellense]